MLYKTADINTRINAKANTVILYRRNDRHLIARVVNRDVDIAYSRFGMMTGPDQYGEPKNSGNPKY